MKIERTKNATRNIIFGVILHIYQTIVPFLMRTVMIYYLGVQYLGLNSLFASILSVLKLAELGVGNAMVYSMYKPIAEDDKETICALMRLYKNYYRIIGLVIAVAGGVLTPFIPQLIHSDLPDGLNIYILYLLHLSATVLSYWLFAYKNSLLVAHQRNDIKNKVVLAVDTGLYIVQFFILLVLKNYYLYVVAVLASQAITNILTSFVVDRMYPQYCAKGKLDSEKVKEINHRVADLFTSKIGMVIVNSADTIVISAFLGLTILAIYQNYFYIMNSVMAIIGILLTSCTAGIGNSLITESQNKNFIDLKKFTFLVTWISGCCTACFLCLYQPFMTIWVGNKLLLPYNAVICLCIYFYVYQINHLLNTFKDAGGIWHEDRFRPLVTALSNLGMNLIMVQFWGIYGIVLSTVLSMVIIGMPWLLHNLFTTMFTKEQLKEYINQIIVYTIVIIAACFFSERICSMINGESWTVLLVRLAICIIIPNGLFFVVYRNRTVFHQCLQLMDQITHHKLMLEKRILKK